MRTRTLTAPDREKTAGRLLDASAKHSFDPIVEIDWDAPLAEDTYYGPPERCSLYGTELWDELSESQRIELSKHEVASVASVGIWFETLLMRVLLRHMYDRDPTSEHVQYALTEIGDECRHSVMFARMIQKLDCPAYGTMPLVHHLGRSTSFFLGQISGLGGALFVEEILDALQRESMRDESLQPLVRAVSRIHVIEESRHIRYAREEITRQMNKANRLTRAYHRLLLGTAVYIATISLVHPRVYAAVGLDPRRARRAARRNPQYRATLTWAARKAYTSLDDLGLIAGPGRWLWKRAGLLEPSTSPQA